MRRRSRVNAAAAVDAAAAAAAEAAQFYDEAQEAQDEVSLSPIHQFLGEDEGDGVGPV